MNLRFQADADLNRAIARGLKRREPSIDYREAAGVIPDGATDAEVLLIAAEANRVLVTRDVGTMPAHFAQFNTEHDSPGLLLVPSGVSIGKIVDSLVTARVNWTPEGLRNQAWWLP